MKYINQKLYLTANELRDLGIFEAFHSGQRRDASHWKFINDPEDKRKVLVEYDTLLSRYKEIVSEKYGNPYEYISSTIIKQLLRTPEADSIFIKKYALADGSSLPVTAQEEYLSACSYLALLADLNCRKVRTYGFESIAIFMGHITRLIEVEKVSLPKSYAKLKAKIREYKKQGAKAVISKKWCNRNSKKVNDEVSESVLLEMISHSSKFDDVIVAHHYNEWAVVSGYKPITDVTVGNYRRKNALTITATRDGKTAFHNQFTPIISRKRPSFPLSMVCSDDNNLDLYFTEGNNKYFRYTLMVVIDNFNDYILGYAVGRSQTIELVRAAYLNAVHHVRELTGEQLSWHQVQADNWGIKALESWYKRQATFIPTQVGNSRSKPIERAFGTTWHQQLKYYPNYSGPNITAKTKRNPDAIVKAKKNFPSIEEGIEQVKDFITRMRTVKRSRTHTTKQEEWLTAFNAMKQEDKKMLSHEERLLVFGKRHTYSNKLTNAGINITIDGKQIRYDVPPEMYMEHVGRTMQVVFDPYDLSHIAATSDDQRVKFVCPVYEKMKMAVMDMTEGDRQLLNVKLEQQKAVGNYAFDQREKRLNVLQQNRINVEGMLQAGVIIKEDRHLAENSYYETRFLEERIEEDEIQQQPEEMDYWDLQMKQEDEQNKKANNHL